MRAGPGGTPFLRDSTVILTANYSARGKERARLRRCSNSYLYAYPLRYDFFYFFFFLDAITDTGEAAAICGRGGRTRTHARSVSIGDWSPRHIGQTTYCTCPDSPLKVNDEQCVIGLRARAFLRSVRRFCRITWARARASSNPRHTCARVLFIDRSNTVASRSKSRNRGEKNFGKFDERTTAVFSTPLFSSINV